MDSHNLRKLIHTCLSGKIQSKISVWLADQMDSENNPSDITRILESDEHITRITVRRVV